MAGLAAAGAAAGTAVMPGIGTAIGGVLGALGDSFMGGGASSSASAPTNQNAQSAIYGDMGLDSSGWNVNFSGVQSSGSNKSAPSALDALGVGGCTGVISPLMIVGVVVVLGLVVWKKSKSSK